MKANNIIPSLGAVAVACLIATSPAQACMGGGMPFLSSAPGASTCPNAQAAPQARPQLCPQGRQDGGQGQSCGLINPELLGALGDMAAGGMQVATHMMRVLAQEAGRYAALDEGAERRP